MYHVELESSNGERYGWDGSADAEGAAISQALSGIPGAKVTLCEKTDAFAKTRAILMKAVDAKTEAADKANAKAQEDAQAKADRETKEAAEKTANESQAAKDAAEREKAETYALQLLKDEYEDWESWPSKKKTEALTAKTEAVLKGDDGPNEGAKN